MTEETKTDALAKEPSAGGVVRQEFGATQMEVAAETASASVAAQARAAVEARYVMAMRAPRDIDDVRVRILRECARPGFAEVARYAKPVGRDNVAGFSIRFAEAAARCLRNVLSEVVTVYDDAAKRIVRVSVIDLESNLTYAKDIVVEKTVERRNLKKGQAAKATRLNSYGDTVYVVDATDDEIANKEAALVSKTLRNGVLRIVPGDVLDEAEALVAKTLADRAAKDPDAERKRIADSFAVLGVMPSDLKTHLGHELATASPQELVRLRAIYSAIKAGECTWAEIAEEKGDESKPGLAGLTEKLKAQNAAESKPESKPEPETKPKAGPPPPPQPKTSPVSVCNQHRDVVLSDSQECWQCAAEAKEKAEAAPVAKTKASGKLRE